MRKRIMYATIFAGVGMMTDLALAGSARVIRTVATSEEAPAGIDPDTRHLGFGIRDFNDAGVVLYHGFVDMPSQSNPMALYRDRAGIGTEMLAREYDSVPGLPDGVLFEGRFSSNFSGAQLNAGGDVLFKARLVGKGVDDLNRFALFTDMGNEGLRAIYRAGERAVGRPAGVNIADFHSDSLVLTDEGGIAFGTLLVGPGANSSNNSALYGSHSGNGAIDFRAVRNSRVPDLEPSTRLGSRFETAPGFNDSGLVAFFTSLSGPSVSNYNDSAILMSDRSGLRTLVREGDMIGTPDGDVVIDSLWSNVELSDSGQALFLSTVRVPGPTGETSRAVVRGASRDSLEIVARSGDRIEGREGLTFAGIQSVGRNPLLTNSSGQFLINGLVRDENLSSSRAVLREGEGGELQAIAVVGDHAVGYDEGSQILNISYDNIELNDSGQVAFSSTVTGGLETVYATDLNNDLMLVTGIDQEFIVNGTPGAMDVRVVSEIDSYSLNDHGELAIALEFQDGTSGVFVMLVPAPPSVLLVSAGLLAFLKRRRARVGS